MKLHKDINNLEIAELLRAVAAAYQLKDASKYKFQIIAYERAADAIEHATSELKDLWDDGKLEDVPGVGKSLSEHLDELFKTGKSKHFEEVMKGLPPAMFELMEVPGIGAKTAYKLVNQLNIKSISQLEEAAKKDKIKNIEGFGEQSQSDILKAIRETKGKTRRHLLPYAIAISSEVINWMLEEKSVKRADPLGSLRRQAATVGDIDIAVASDKPKEVLEHFTKYPKAQRILEKGDHTASIIVPGDVQVDLMVQPPDSYGSLLQHFTGSKHHNIALREYALKEGLSLSEYGIRKIHDSRSKIQEFNTEKKFYNHLGLEWIPPELREDSGEIEAALKSSKAFQGLPHLVELKDIKADLQIHSDFDIETSHDLGESSMEDIIRKAGELGYEYLAFTEHNPSKSKHSEQQIVDILKRKRERVDELNYRLACQTEPDHALREKGVKNVVHKSYSRVIKVFNSLEIDMLPEGGLPVSEGGLETLDFALVSIHSSFDLSREAMIKRVLSALSHPKVKIFAHPTTRKLNEREGVELDWPKIFDFCKSNHKWIEINAQPGRLDLPDTLVKEAVKIGVKLTLGTDAHHKNGMNSMRFGVSVARRGWATKNDIINTRSLIEFEKLLE